jgi:HSP20 family protein
MFDRMQNLFEEFQDKGKEITGLGGVPVDVQEEGNHIVVKADIPGVTKEDISLKADADSLEISAESTEEVQEENEKYFRKERHSRTFRRSIKWPKAIDPETVEASYDEGVLTVKAEKEGSDGRDIEIE